MLILSQVSCAAVLFFLSKGRYDESDDRFCTNVRDDKRGEANLYGPDRLVESIFGKSSVECVPPCVCVYFAASFLVSMDLLDQSWSM